MSDGKRLPGSFADELAREGGELWRKLETEAKEKAALQARIAELERQLDGDEYPNAVRSLSMYKKLQAETLARAEKAEARVEEYKREVERREEMLAKPEERDVWAASHREVVERAESAEKALAEAREEIDRQQKAIDCGGEIGSQCGVCGECVRRSRDVAQSSTLRVAAGRFVAQLDRGYLQADLASARAQLTVEVANNVALREALETVRNDAIEHGKRFVPNWQGDGPADMHEAALDEAFRDFWACANAALSSPSPGAPLLAALRMAHGALDNAQDMLRAHDARHREDGGGPECGCEYPVTRDACLNALAQIREVLGD